MLKNTHLRVGLLAATLTLLPGCFLSRSSLNDPLRPGRFTSLVPGQTTSAEVAKAVGAPAEVVQLGHRSAWRYEHTVEKKTGLFLIVIGLLNKDSRSDRAWVFFDEDGTLTHVATTMAADETEFELPWSAGSQARNDG